MTILLNPAANREMIEDGTESENQMLLHLIIELFENFSPK